MVSFGVGSHLPCVPVLKKASPPFQESFHHHRHHPTFFLLTGLIQSLIPTSSTGSLCSRPSYSFQPGQPSSQGRSHSTLPQYSTRKAAPTNLALKVIFGKDHSICMLVLRQEKGQNDSRRRRYHDLHFYDFFLRFLNHNLRSHLPTDWQEVKLLNEG